MPDRYWKVLNAKGESCHGGSLTWSLPKWNGRRWTPGKWMPRIEDPVLCVRGYHLCRDGDLLTWLHEGIWRVEIHPKAVTIAANDKVVTSGPVRLVAGTAWGDEVARLFAVACAVDVLHLFETVCPGDTCVSDAIVAAWEFAHGFASAQDMAAARDAAGGAAWTAAWTTAWDAARNAAWDAARAAAGAAARAAAGSAAWNAAWNAAWAAAWNAAGSAAGNAQTARLLRYLDGDVDV